MRLIWWKKCGKETYDYEICLESRVRKKVISYRQTILYTWHDTYYGMDVSNSVRLVLTGYKRAIEWGTHDDKERKNTHKQLECQKAE